MRFGDALAVLRDKRLQEIKLIEMVMRIPDPERIMLGDMPEAIAVCEELLLGVYQLDAVGTVDGEQIKLDDLLELVLIHNLREMGVPWSRIGELVGMTASGAFKRYKLDSGSKQA